MASSAPDPAAAARRPLVAIEPPDAKITPLAIRSALSQYLLFNVIVPLREGCFSDRTGHLNTLIDFPELLHCFGHSADYIVNFLFRIETSESEPKSAVGHLIAYPKRFQYVARLNAGRRTCR